MKIPHWNEWHYWLRGGAIALVVYLLYIFFEYIVVPRAFYTICETGYCPMPWVEVVQQLYTYSVLPLWSTFLANYFFESTATYIIAGAFYYFFIGMVIGVIVAKVRKGKAGI